MPVRRLLTAIALGAVSALILAGPAAASSCPGADTEAAGLGDAQIEASITCLINEERSAAGLRQVRSNTTLRQAALGHSQDMVNRSYFEHTSPSGVSFIDRITANGYMRGARRWLVGENLVWGSGTESTPASMVEGWMQSPPHRANLLRSRFREVGVAAVRGTPYDASDSSGVTISSEYGARSRKHIRPLKRHRLKRRR